MKSNKQLADEYREKSGRDGGVVVVYEQEVQGWSNELRNPERYIAGCVAIDREGNEWIATGGNDYDGAESWQQLAEAALTSTVR